MQPLAWGWQLYEERASLTAKGSASVWGLQPGQVLGCWAWARTAEAGPSCPGGWVTFCSLTEFLSKLAHSYKPRSCAAFLLSQEVTVPAQC